MLELLKEFGEFLLQRKKFWLIPIVVVLLFLIAISIIAQGSGALSPFIYALF